MTKQNYIDTEKKFFASLLKSFNKDLLLYCVTGSLARNKIIPGWSDIDILLVVRKCDLMTISKIHKALKEAQSDIKIGLTFYSLLEFNNVFFKDSKTYLSIKFINEKHYIPRILSSEIKIQLPPKEILKYNDAFEFTRFINDLRRELLIKDTRNERKLYKLAITTLKIALRQKGIITLGYQETINKAHENLVNFHQIKIPDPEEIIAKPFNVLERYKTYEEILKWAGKNIDTLFS